MQQQRAAVVEFDQNVLAAPGKLADASAFQPLAEVGRERPPQIRRPRMRNASPRRTVSTSGSSGIALPHYSGEPGCLLHRHPAPFETHLRRSPEMLLKMT
jgi:hypothetical protein